MKADEIGKEIISNAMHFVNLYETKANAEWHSILDPSKGKAESDELIVAMKATGWNFGLPYCAAYVEAIWRMSYKKLNAPTAIQNDVALKLTPSVILSYNNWRGKVSRNPVPGSIFFMQNGSSSTGHTGIIVACDGYTLATIEGNTSAGKAVSTEADRNGDGIFKKTRTLDFSIKSKGLHLLGFLNPIEW